MNHNISLSWRRCANSRINFANYPKCYNHFATVTVTCKSIYFHVRSKLVMKYIVKIYQDRRLRINNGAVPYSSHIDTFADSISSRNFALQYDSSDIIAQGCFKETQFSREHWRWWVSNSGSIIFRQDPHPLNWLVLLRGVVPTPLTVFALVLKIAQPRGKITPGTFKFILSLHFNEKIPNLPPTPGVG